ncbi:MAG TPA: hypothetical protein VFZ70_10275 [Euzebyales bacterium]
MASVRASLITQARMAARHLDGATATANHPAVDRLVRCAQLSQDATRTLEWALESLQLHGVDRTDSAACQLLGAAIAKLGSRAGNSAGDLAEAASRSLAWR